MTDDTVTFVHALVAEVPPLGGLLAEHVAANHGVLSHVFMGDVSRFVIEEHRAASAGSGEPHARLFGVLERAMAGGSDAVQELISVSFLENLAEDFASTPALRAYLGPSLKRELRVIHDAFGY